MPWRVCSSGPVFRFEREPEPTHAREFTQAGVELLGAPGPEADAEVIALAVDAAAAAGIADASLRIGHAGLILELLERSGLPSAAVSAMVEHLSDAAAEGRGVRSLETALDRLAALAPRRGRAGGRGRPPRRRPRRRPAASTASSATSSPGSPAAGPATRSSAGFDRSGTSAGRSAPRSTASATASTPWPTSVGRPSRCSRGSNAASAALAPGTIRDLFETLRHLESRGLPPERVELDLGFGHGIGFYSQMIFELSAPTPSGPLGICHGGRYDGLARVLGSDRDPHGVGFAFGVERLYHALGTAAFDTRRARCAANRGLAP